MPLLYYVFIAMKPKSLKFISLWLSVAPFTKRFQVKIENVLLRLYLPFTCIQNKSSSYTKMFQVEDMFEVVLKMILCKPQLNTDARTRK